MNRQQAAEFIHALNMLQPHVAPLLFSSVAASEVVRLIVAVANGHAACDVKVLPGDAKLPTSAAGK